MPFLFFIIFNGSFSTGSSYPPGIRQSSLYLLSDLKYIPDFDTLPVFLKFPEVFSDLHTVGSDISQNMSCCRPRTKLTLDLKDAYIFFFFKLRSERRGVSSRAENVYLSI